MQLPLLDTESDWTPPSLSDLPQSWSGVKRIGYDLETYAPHLFETGPSVRTGGHVAGYCLGFEDGPAFYLPVRHKGGDNLDPDQVENYFRDNFKKYDGEVVGAHLQYDLLTRTSGDTIWTVSG